MDGPYWTVTYRWGDFLGPGKAFDTDKYLVVCCNVLTSCYGSTGPTSINPTTGKPYGSTFPEVTLRDAVGLQIRTIREGLGANRVAAVVGGSLGGMQVTDGDQRSTPL